MNYSIEGISCFHGLGEYADEFGEWWETLLNSEKESIAASVQLLEEFGPSLRFPHSSGVNSEKRAYSMAKKFAELRSRMTPKSQARVTAKAAAMRAEMPLQEIRQARGLSQKMLAEILKVNQPAIAKMEKRADAYISTLRSHIEAMGGELEIIARFPEGSVKITNFSGLDSPMALQAPIQDPNANLIDLP